MSGATRIFLFCSLLSLSLAAAPARADRAFVQPESIGLGDIAELVIEYENKIPSLYALDTSGLEHDFELLQKDSRVIRLNEGDTIMHRMQWRLQITPRSTGRLQIPPIRYGDRATAPIFVDVAPQTPPGRSARQVYLELDNATPRPYVGQQTSLQTRLYHDTPIAAARLIEPHAGELRIRRSAAEKTYRVERAGRQYQVLQQEMILFPQKAGPLELAPASYHATIADSRQEIAGQRRIVRHSAPLRLQVRPPPRAFSGRFWLPASRLQLSRQWSGGDDRLRIGDSLNLTLTIVAHGLPAESLPLDLLSSPAENLRIYADQASLHNRIENGQMIGQLEQRFALVVTAPGNIVLPPVSLKWWDVINDREVESRLEGRSFEVGGDLAQALPDQADGSLLARLAAALDPEQGPWLELLSALPVLALVILVGYRLRRYIAQSVRSIRQHRRRWHGLKRACLANDARAARVALLEWARHCWPTVGIYGLRQVAELAADADLRQRLDELDTALYARTAGNWQGRRLWQALAARRGQRRQRRGITAAGLPPLYPDQASASSSNCDQPSTGSKRAPYLPA